MNILELLNQGSKELNLNNIKTHILDSEILLSKILNKSREKILLNPKQEVKLEDTIKFKKLIKRRSLKEPVAYILNEKEFWVEFLRKQKHFNSKTRNGINGRQINKDF